MQDNYFTTETLKAALQAKGINTNAAAKPVIDAMISKGAIIQGINDSKVAPTKVAPIGTQDTTTPDQGSGDNILSRGYNAVKEAIPSLVDSFQKRAQDITDTSMKTSDQLYNTKVSDAPVTKQNVLDFLNPMKSESDNQDNPLQQMETKYLAPVRNALNVVGNVAGGAADILGAGIKAGYKTLTPEHAQILLADGLHSIIQTDAGKAGLAALGQGMDTYNKWAEANPDKAKEIGNVLNIATLGVGKTAEGVATPIINDAVDATKGFVKDTAIPAVKDAANATVDTLVTKPVEAVSDAASAIKNKVADTTKKGIDAVKSSADEAFLSPTADEAAKNNLNPFIANVAEVSIPVKSEGGITKYIVKNAKDATPNEITAYKDEAKGLYNKFTAQAKKFMTERTVEGGSPVEQVGQKTDKYVAQVAKLRRDVGKQMGKIEDAAENVQVPFNKSQTVQDFVLETADAIKNGFKYGPNSGITPEITKLSEDILRLEKSGSSVKDTLNMTRKWARYLEDQKDKFGDFTSNKSANVQIQNVIRSMKNDARSVLAENNDTYKTLVQGYAKTSKFGEEAKRLMGQEGLYGDSIKGAATVKRAIQSNSDAGARQFLKTLRDITGYDAIKEGDIALKAMKDVGDYQGLSLLNVLNDVKGGVLGTTKNVVKRAITPSEAKKTMRYINK